MSGLSHDANIARPDDFYAQLVALHDGLDQRESAVVNAKIILMLANHIGDEAVLYEVLDIVRPKRVAI